MNGFQIEIQKDLNKEEMENAINYANGWIASTCDDMIFYLGGKTGGYKSYLLRGRFGYMPYKSESLVFRRISYKRRVFGIVRANTMTLRDGSEIDLKQCMCPIHRGGERVMWRNGTKPETFIYAKVGSVRDKTKYD